VQEDAAGRWDKRYSDEPEVGEPSGWLVSLASRLLRPGLALDVAGGSGRNALWLAKQGWAVTVLDVSTVGLRVAAQEAARRGLSIETLAFDLETQQLPTGPWDLILCLHYLQRSLFSEFPGLLSDEGLLVCEIATVRNLERHENPRREFLLDERELPSLATDLEIVEFNEGWMETDRHVARLVAQARQ